MSAGASLEPAEVASLQPEQRRCGGERGQALRGIGERERPVQQPHRGEDALHLLVADEMALERRARQRRSVEEAAPDGLAPDQSDSPRTAPRR